MEVLVLSCGMGGGHNAAGRAVAEELERRGHHATFMNAFELKGRKTAALINNAYIRIAQLVPGLFGAIYFLGEAYRRLPIPSPVYWANGKMSGYLQRLLDEHHFDTIVATHTFPAQTLTAMKRKGTPRSEPVRRPGQAGGHRRPHGGGQDHHHQSADAVL